MSKVLHHSVAEIIENSFVEDIKTLLFSYSFPIDLGIVKLLECFNLFYNFPFLFFPVYIINQMVKLGHSLERRDYHIDLIVIYAYL